MRGLPRARRVRAAAGLIALALCVAARPAVAAPPGAAPLLAEVAAIEAQVKSGPAFADTAATSRKAEALGRQLVALGDLGDGGSAIRVASMISSRAGDTARAGPLAAESHEICRRGGNTKCMAAALVVSGVVDRRKGDLTSALERYRAAAAIYLKLGDAESAGKTRLNAANVQNDLGDAVGAAAAFAQIAAAYPPGQLKYVALRNSANPLMDMGRYAEARRVAAQALVLAHDPRVNFGAMLNPVCLAVNVLGRAAGHLGDASLVPELRRCLKEAQASGPKSDIHFAAEALAETLVSTGQAAAALPVAEEALRTGDVSDSRDMASTLRLAALAHAATGDSVGALALADRAFATERAFEQSRTSGVMAGALASTALSEREALLQVTRSQAALRATEDARRIERLQLATTAAVVLVVLVAAALFAAYRVRQLRLRDAELLAERGRVARDLHDTLLQGLAGVTMQLKGAARTAEREGAPALAAQLGGLAQTSGASLAEARNAVWCLRAPFAEDGDLTGVVEAWLQELRATTPATLRLHAASPLPRLSPGVVEAVFRVVQESVVNALRHGEPREVGVSLTAERRRLTAVVSDDGRGFDVDASRAGAGGHWGLLGARERIARLKGRLEIRSAPGEGARVEATVPL